MTTPPISDKSAEELCKPVDQSTEEFIMQQTMYRIKDPKKSIPFYTGVLGMRLLTKIDVKPLKFTLYFLGYENENDLTKAKEAGVGERMSWAMSRKATLELTHNWGSENDDTKYHTGNTDPRGFGHIGIHVPDVEKACKRFEELGVEFVKKPQDGKMRGLAFIKDPDGYWIEIFTSKNVANVVAEVNEGC